MPRPANTYVPSPLTMHGTALQTSSVSETGDHAGKTMFPSVATTQNWFLLARIEVMGCGRLQNPAAARVAPHAAIMHEAPC